MESEFEVDINNIYKNWVKRKNKHIWHYIIHNLYKPYIVFLVTPYANYSGRFIFGIYWDTDLTRINFCNICLGYPPDFIWTPLGQRGF